MNAAEKFINRAVVLFGDPDSPDPEAFLDEYRRHLKNYTAPVLDRAMDILVRSRKFKTWPAIGEIVDAAQKAGAENARPEPPKFHAGRDFIPRADGAMKTQMAKEAAQNGWVLGLYDHWAEKGREPTAAELDEIKESAAFLTRCTTGAVDMGVAHNALLGLSHSMFVRREKLIRMVLGERPMTDAEAETFKSSLMDTVVKRKSNTVEEDIGHFRPLGAVDREAFAEMQQKSRGGMHRRMS